MVWATKPRGAVVFLTILTLGLPLGLPAENAPETVYDESEALPYESIPLLSIVVPLVAARGLQFRQAESRQRPLKGRLKLNDFRHR